MNGDGSAAGELLGTDSGELVEARSEPWSELTIRCRDGDVSAVYETADELLKVRRALGRPAAWRQFISSHKFSGLKSALQEDPFAYRAAAKPRGYAGDAVLLDFAYRLQAPPDETSDRGRRIFDMTTNSPGSRSVRARKKSVSQWIDDLSDAIDHPRIASLASGHLRELECSVAFREGRLGQFVAVDQDAESVAYVSSRYASTVVEAHCATLKEFLTGKVVTGTFDGVYAAGLFDYFDDGTAVRAMAGMLRNARPGGRVLLANLTPTLIDVAYMEAVMDWWLIYRTEDQMKKLAELATVHLPASIKTWHGVLGNVAYVEFTREG